MSWEIRQGDALERLREMNDESVQTVVTSPPYWGLRDYGTGGWEGGDEGCDHRKMTTTGTHNNGRDRTKSGGTFHGAAKTSDDLGVPYADTCGKCGARRIDSQLGLEPTPEQYVANLIEVFREVRRVLRRDGTAWLNLGDSYAGSWGNQGRKPERGEQRPINGPMLTPVHDGRYPNAGSNTGQTPPGLKPKDLCGIPWRTAFALQADGWWLRSDVIWSKPNPMPESVTDRPTRAHEYLFLLTKSARYFFDSDAVREEGPDWSKGGPGMGITPTLHYGADNGGNEGLGDLASRYKSGEQATGRNIRSVWQIATQPYPDAHFATFPPKLVEPCILAGSPPKCCGECGAPWERVTERKPMVVREGPGREGAKAAAVGSATRTQVTGTMLEPPESRTVGWRSTCAHDDDSARSVVLDPFAGSGTTGVVALRHDRSFIGIELSPDYCEMARNRIRDDQPLFNYNTEVAA